MSYTVKAGEVLRNGLEDVPEEVPDQVESEALVLTVDAGEVVGLEEIPLAARADEVVAEIKKMVAKEIENDEEALLLKDENVQESIEDAAEKVETLYIIFYFRLSA